MVRLFSFPCPAERRRRSGGAPSRACPHSLGSRATKTPSSCTCVCLNWRVCRHVYRCACVRACLCSHVALFYHRALHPLCAVAPVNNMNNMLVYVNSPHGAQELVRLMITPYVHYCFQSYLKCRAAWVSQTFSFFITVSISL